MLDPELVRYIEHLQRQIMDQDYAECFNPARFVQWLESNSPSVQRLLERHRASDSTLITEYMKSVCDFNPQFKYDSAHSTSVFLRILRKVEVACAALNVNPKRPVILVPSTAIGLSPMARPSSGEHLLFAGLGTMAFCNYWAKAYGRLLSDFSQRALPETLDNTDLAMLARSFPEHILLPSRLLLRYGYFGTLLGLGELQVDPLHDGLRVELLEAMEMFAIGHEIGHFVAEEISPTNTTSVDITSAHAIELFCDQYGQAIARWDGAKEAKWSSFAATGAILYLHSGDMSLRLSKRIAGISQADCESQSHPRTWDRIDRLVSDAVRCVPSDQQEAVRCYLNEILAVIRFIESEVFETIVSTVDKVRQREQAGMARETH
jgi:hypothetical protein